MIAGLIVLALAAYFLGRRSSLGVRAMALPVVRASVPAAPVGASKQSLVSAYGKIPMSFEANQGQADPQVQFLTRGRGYNLFLASTEAVLVLAKSNISPPEDRREARLPERRDAARESAAVLRMKLLGADPHASISGVNQLPGKSNYFIGNDPSKWHTDVPRYAKVRYQQVYAGVDLVYYGNQRQLEYDFVVSPGADPGVIRINFQGASKIDLDDKGDLVLHTDGGDVRQHKPKVYQEENGARRELAGGYVLAGANQVGFQVAEHNPTQALVIDPVLSYSTYLGGAADDSASDLAVDAAGNAYVVGGTMWADFPVTPGVVQGQHGGVCNYVGCKDAFIMKLSPDGSQIVFSTFLGGSEMDVGYAIAVDGSGYVYVAGQTMSTNFPTANALQGTNHLGDRDAFIAKLNPTGSALVYSTYLGGSSGMDVANAIAVDASGSAYVAGFTTSSNFPTASALQATLRGDWNGFISKLSPAGSLVFSTYLGGSGGSLSDEILSIAVDGSGSVYVGGYTRSSDFPTTPGAFRTVYSGGRDGFVTKLNPAGNQLVYSTFIGGSLDDGVDGIAVDSFGRVYAVGNTESTDFPTTAGAVQVAKSGSSDAFLVKLTASGNSLVYSTLLGGNDLERADALSIDNSGSAYLSGFTKSTDFPLAKPIQSSNAGDWEGYVAVINTEGAGLLFSTYIGGRGQDWVNGIGLQGSSIYGIGGTHSTDFPTANALQTKPGGAYDAVVFKISGIDVIPLPGKLYGVTACCPSRLVTINPSTGTQSAVGNVTDASSSLATGATAVDVGNNRLFLVKRSPPRLLSADLTTGVVTEKTLTDEILALGFHSTAGKLYGVTACCPNRFVSIDPATGSLTSLGNVGDASVPLAAGAAAIDPANNRFFLARRSSPQILVIDTSTGAVTPSPTLSSEMLALGFHSTTGKLYGLTACCPNRLVTIDPTTGSLTSLGNVGDASTLLAAGAVAIDPAANRFYLARRSSPQILAVDTQTGALTPSSTLSNEVILLGVKP